VDLSLREVLTSRSVAGLAVEIARHKAAALPAAEVLEMLRELEAMPGDKPPPESSPEPPAPASSGPVMTMAAYGKRGKESEDQA
jgi:hypothetical protein